MNILNQWILQHIDMGTIAILFCLMAVVAGFTELGYMDRIAGTLVKKAGSLGKLMISLTMVTFGVSMFVTNDVALIVMVPFTIQVLGTIGCNHKLMKLVVLETIAANLGSMMTPIGNPQNVYLYQQYHMTIGRFLRAVVPYGLVAAVVIVLLLLMDKDRAVEVVLPKEEQEHSRENVGNKQINTILYSILFVICLLNVLGVISCEVTVAVTVVGIGLSNYRLFQRVDYGLLVKFLILFVLVGNLADIPWISNCLGNVVSGNEFIAGVGMSQCLSNVPTAIMLSGFTENGMELLQGVNVGGLGTLIASMASMISFEYYGKAVGADKKRYVVWFSLYNMGFLTVMLFVKVLFF